MSEEAKNELSMEQLEGVAGGVGPNVKALMTDLRTGVNPPQSLLDKTRLGGFLTAIQHFGSTHASILQSDPKLAGLTTQLHEAESYLQSHPNAEVGSYAGASALMKDVGMAMSYVQQHADGGTAGIPGGWNRVTNTEDNLLP